MQDFLTKLKKSAGHAATRAGNKAEEIKEVTALKNKINTARSDIGIAKKDIGDYCFKLFRDGKLEDPQLIELCEQIRDSYAEIEAMEQQIEDARQEYRDKSDALGADRL